MSLTGGGRHGTPARTTRFRPGLEQFEDRRVPANLGSISGHVFIDPTGNGAAPANPPQSHVTVKLFQDTNGDGVLDSGDVQVASRVSGADGSYSFGNLAAGRYFVTEAVPGGWVRTAPTLSSSYTVNLADGQASAGNDFDNFHKPNTAAVTDISFQVTDNGTTTTVTNLRGQTHQGDTVTVNFTVLSTVTSATVTLVAYDAPGPSFDANTASQQVPVQVVGGTFTPGTYSLTVMLPPNFYQVDFVAGSAIAQLGPAGSNIFYSAQGRLLSADNGGTNPVAPTTPSLSGTVLSDNGGVTPNTGLSGVTVTLTQVVNGQTVTLTTTTDQNGNYSFTGLTPGTYTVQVTPPIGYTDETGSTTVALTPGTTATGYNFLEMPPLT